ncbi:hypothetical protein F3Y22_tig00111166pilonHSYRG00079 [Hibiscus syriacus]|uniref:Uncharacterized protein n=1 Tax=Hibiscus syriacus TaxID=106335 RepID=A0A6A2YWK2_HIBSY|nr:hypothetical protein F3Y22_tig00111166pilonHSYRG00079 [Hibiscus syriacus]
MTLINIPTGRIQVRKTLSIDRKPLMLKDYLRDDLSSCSSSGFKSFPRRHCCTTVRFLLETDLKRSNGNYSTSTKRLLKRSRSKASSTSTTISALQRASEAVLNAVKILPFPSIKSSSSTQSSRRRKGKADLPRSFARKLFKRRSWRKADKEDNHGRGEIKRWKLFRKFLEEKNQQSLEININSYTTTDTSSTVVTTSKVSTSRSSNRWKKVNLQRKFYGLRAVTPRAWVVTTLFRVSSLGVGLDKQRNKATVESGIGSRLPLDREEEEDGSVFEDQLARVEGTKERLMQKITRFERLAQLEPLELEKRIATAEAELEDEDEEDKPESNHQKLVELSKPKIPDLFVRERLLMEEFGVNILKNENPQEWKEAYVKEMEENVNWIKFNVEKEEVGSALQLELFTSLLDDLLIDLFSL